MYRRLVYLESSTNVSYNGPDQIEYQWASQEETSAFQASQTNLYNSDQLESQTDNIEVDHGKQSHQEKQTKCLVEADLRNDILRRRR